MENKQLNNISALLDFGVDAKTMQPWLSFAAMSQLLTLRITGLVYMGFSRDWEDSFSGDSHVLDVVCEHRQLSQRDLSGYAFRVMETESLPKLTIIRIEGPLNVKIICHSFDISFEPLKSSFPEMT